MRQPNEIIIGGVTMGERLKRHAMWLRGEPGGKRLCLSGTDLSDADLRRAVLSDANLRYAALEGCVGNMREVKSAQFDRWALVWTTDPEGVVTLSIGCQSHPLAKWEKSDPRWIAALDDDATEWWAQYRDAVLALVRASPATPWGKQEDNG